MLPRSPSSSPVVTLYTIMYHVQNPTFCSLNIFMCFVCFPHQRDHCPVPSDSVLLETLGRQLPALYANRSFTTEFLSWTRSIQSTSLCYLLELHFNIILPPTPRPSKWSLPITYTHRNPERTFPLLHTCHIPRPSHSSWFEHADIWWGIQIMKLLLM